MFQEPLGRIQYATTIFEENVQDEFGHALIEEIFHPINKELTVLNNKENEAINEKSNIETLLNEARSIT